MNLSTALEYLSSPKPHRIHNALLWLRSHQVKQRDGMTKFRHRGGLMKLLTLLSGHAKVVAGRLAIRTARRRKEETERQRRREKARREREEAEEKWEREQEMVEDHEELFPRMTFQIPEKKTVERKQEDDGGKKQEDGEESNETEEKELVTSEERKQIDMALSILGNCSMEEDSRITILKEDGIKILGLLLSAVNVESIRNRICRCLGNLSQNRLCSDVIHQNGHREVLPSHIDIAAATTTTSPTPSAITTTTSTTTTSTTTPSTTPESSSAVVTQENQGCKNVENTEEGKEEMAEEEEEEAVEIVGEIVKLLETTQDPDCQQTYLRTLRLLCDSSEHQEHVISAGAVKSVCLALKAPVTADTPDTAPTPDPPAPTPEESESQPVVHGDDKVLTAALRTLTHLTKIVEKEPTVWQLMNGDGPTSLVHIASTHPLPSVSLPACSLLLHFTKLPMVRPTLGPAGAITLFLDKLADDTLPPKPCIPYISGLCLCCKEVVNRLRIREGGGLPLLLRFLDQSQFRSLHYRIVSALVCFLYDEAGMEILRNNELVAVLQKQLRRVARLDDKKSDEKPELKAARKVTFIVGDDEEEEEGGKEDKMDIEIGTGGKKRKSEVLGDSSKSKMIKLDLQITEHSDITNPSLMSDSITESVEHISKTEAVSKIEDDGKEVSGSAVIADLQKSNQKNIIHPKVDHEDTQPRYSIDSPTYKAISEFQLRDDFEVDGPRNIMDAQQLSPGSPLSPWPSSSSGPHSPSSRSGSYSPLSVSSYLSADFSPEGSPKPPSPTFSDDFSPRSLSPSSFSPFHSAEPPVSVRSAGSFSALWWCPDNLKQSQEAEYSEEEETANDDLNITTSSNIKMATKLEISSEEALDTDPVYVDTMASTDFGRALQGASIAPTPRVLTPCVSTDSIREFQRRMKSSGKKKRTPTADEKHRIQRRLSSGSLASSSELDFEDLITKLKTAASPKPEGKLDGLDIDKYKDPRKATEYNILIILSKLSYVDDPSVDIVRSDLLETLLDYVSKASDPLPRASRILSRVTTNPLCFEKALQIRFPCILESKLKHTGAEGKRKPEKGVGGGKKGPSQMDKKRKAEDAEGPSFPGVEELHSLLLTNLMVTAESRFGVGVMEHIFLTKPHHMKLSCALGLPYLCRSDTVCSRFLLDGDGLHLICQSLLDEAELSSAIPTLLHLSQVFRPPHVHEDITEQEDVPTSDQNQGKTDLAFVLDNGTKVLANRQTMMETSEVFSAMLGGHFAESAQSQVVLAKVDQSAFEILVQCLSNDFSTFRAHVATTGNKTVKTMLNLLELSHRYLIQSMIERTLKGLTKMLSKVTFGDIMTFSRQHHLTDLAVVCGRYVLWGCDLDEADRIIMIRDNVKGQGRKIFVEVLEEVLAEVLKARKGSGRHSSR